MSFTHILILSLLLRFGGALIKQRFAEANGAESSANDVAARATATVRSCFGANCKHWTDTNGDRIEAHGAGMLYSEKMGRWYWYGESAKTWVKGKLGSLGGSINCYSSPSLVGPWKFEGQALRQEQINTSKAEGPYVVERPKVLFNSRTQMYLMWFHADTGNYKFRQVGVATSSSPTGPFNFSHVFEPDGLASLDMSLFLDYDGQAYFVRSVENAFFAISRLTDDFMDTTGVLSHSSGSYFGDAPCLEGFAIFRQPYDSNGTLYMMTSHCESWNPNPLMVLKATGKTLKNPDWVNLGNPTGEYVSFNSQPCFVVQDKDADGNVYPVYLADNWIHGGKRGLQDASYVWLPLDIKPNGRVVMDQYHAWDPAHPFADDGSYTESWECRTKVKKGRPQCWARLPEGCSQPLRESKTPKSWFAVPDERTWQSCTQRVADFKAWCGTSNVEHTFTRSAVRQHCRPEGLTTRACWISMPSGCDRRPRWKDAQLDSSIVPCWVNAKGCVEPYKEEFLLNHPPHDWFMGLDPMDLYNDEQFCMMRAMQVNEHCNRTDAQYSFGPLPPTPKANSTLM